MRVILFLAEGVKGFFFRDPPLLFLHHPCILDRIESTIFVDFRKNFRQKSRMLDSPGVYLAIIPATGEFYVGSTKTSFRERFRSQLSALASGVASEKLQAAYDANPQVVFRPLKVFPPDEVHAREREAIARLRPVLNVYTPDWEILDAAARTGLTESAIRYRREKGIPLSKPKGLRVTVAGIEYTYREAAAKFGVKYETIRYRVSRGYTGADVVRTVGKS